MSASLSLFNLFSLIAEENVDGVVKFLEKTAININQYLLPSQISDESFTQYEYYTPLYFATKLNNQEIIKALLKNGADVNKVVHDKEGLFASSYDYATLNNNMELVNFFNQYVTEKSSQSIRTKKRSENALSFDFKSKKKAIPAEGVLQRF